jgi:hypothetical protein
MNRNAASRWYPHKVNVWYIINPGTTYQDYFYAQSENKNGGLSGIKVTEKARSAKAVKYNTGPLFDGDQRKYVVTPENEIPDQVKEAAKDKGAHIASSDALILRVAARFVQADQPPGMRKEVKDLTQPVNRLKGINRQLAKEHGELMESGIEETVDPQRRDIRPEDVFHPKPDQIGMLNLAETGNDLSKAIRTQVPKDKGYAAVRNLSQYLVETQGGGSADPVQ